MAEIPGEKRVVFDDGTPAYSDCIICEHFIGGHFKGWTCKAFPKGIPLNVWRRDIQHDKPLVGQGNDLVYRKRKKPLSENQKKP